MKTFFGKILFGQLAVSIAVLIIMSFIFSAAVRSSISSWNSDKQWELQELLMPVISKAYRLNGSLSEQSLEKALLPYITDSLYVYVFDTEKNPILLMEDGKPRTLEEVEKKTGSIGSFISLNSPVPIKDGETVIGYLLVDNVDFLAYKANRLFISTIKRASSIGAVFAVLFAVGFSLFTASVFSKKTTSLSKSITEIQSDSQEIPFTGIQELDKISRAVIKLKERLKYEESLRRQWMQDISHDLRTPLTAVKMQVEGLSDGVLKADNERFSALYSELNHIERLVCNLQELSRYESPETKINRSAIKANEFVEEIKDRFSILAERMGIQFKCDCLIKNGQEVFGGDMHLLQRCVSNIIQNAFQHTEKNGEIIFFIKKIQLENEPKIIFTVLNTGVISETDIPHVFERLYRSDRSRSSEGNGLGLSIAKAIVNLHNGKISIENVIENQKKMVKVYIEIPFAP